MQFTNIFGLYWGVFFFSAFGEMVLAGVFSQVMPTWSPGHFEYSLCSTLIVVVLDPRQEERPSGLCPRDRDV